MSNTNGRLSNPWDKVAKRLAVKARATIKQRGDNENFAIIQISVVVDNNGSPIGWTAPSGNRLEPRGPWVLGTDLIEPIKD